MGTLKISLSLAALSLAAAPLAAQTAGNSTDVYSGTGQITFAGSFDDSVLVRIDGSSIYGSGGWGNTGNTGFQLTPGWHDVEFRFDNTSAVGGSSMNLFRTDLPAAAPQAEAQVPEPTLIGLASLSAIALFRRPRRSF